MRWKWRAGRQAEDGGAVGEATRGVHAGLGSGMEVVEGEEEQEERPRKASGLALAVA